jgi:glutamate-1-semialdehyde 2,1-aminomutase/spore coat polysaccharide biosynthesis protein SpsF
MSTVAIIQARMGASRLPGKVLADLAGMPVLQWVVRAARAIPGVDRVAVATSTEAGDEPIAAWCAREQVACQRGSEQDVLDRYALAARNEGAKVVLRITADCPLLDPQVCGQVLTLLQRSGAQYASNVDPASWPDGLDCEALTAEALFTAASEATRAPDREHVTSFVRNRRRRFRAENLLCPLPGLASERWTLDTQEDLAFLRALAAHLSKDAAPTHLDVLRALDAHPELRAINARSLRNEGFEKSLAREQVVPENRVYAESQALLARAERVIPLGSQTFSKSKVQYPEGHAPLFLTHGQGGRVWDVDGNEYVDLVNGLLPVVLGYRDPDVDAAIQKQLGAGISFSLATELEIELAQRLCDEIPCAEMVRFGKNGTDATSAAIRIARAATGRERIMVCGYHGWQDWYIGATTRNKGVPQAVQGLTHMVPYNDLGAVEQLLQQFRGEFAAMILEPMNSREPAAGYLAGLKELLHRHGALLVFDEIITGFRYSLGGAQRLFEVTPDLSSFGKALGNGLPIAAIVGRADLMRQLEEVYFSGTFGGEALSLAAGIAVIDKMRREPVIETLWSTGRQLETGVRELLAEHGLQDVMTLRGKPAWVILEMVDHPKATKEAIKTLFIIEMLRNGVLCLGTHNVSYAHNQADVARVLGAYHNTLGTIARELATGKLEQRLPGPALKPVFRVR